ncbi:MAG: type II toxin-antitoxin system MqsA family antitoxin [Ruminiclostridium sp.]|nr:type II toxin-antitoxin system MqsA family antitoxin [Ruminiclostridium sp.]MBR4111851.1 type II toxin-antitoxin system MqsA family antitoxin [Ruminiclostridium sp.]
MTCFFCKGSMVESTTIHTVELKNCIVVIKNVPCLKCDQCGEVVINGEVAQRIEQIVAGFEKALTEIAVVNYSAA